MDTKVVPATRALLSEIQTWLEAEDSAYRAACDTQAERWDPEIEIPERGFFCNWNIVLSSFERDPNNVHVLVVDGKAIGFVDEMDILEVHPGFRGRGFGRVLADFMLRRAFELGHSVAEIEVAPETALPFWKSMGFLEDSTRSGAGGGIYAYRRLERPLTLGPGPRVPYRIGFYEPSRDWDNSVEPFAVFAGEGEKLTDGSVRLAERAYCFDARQPTSTDCVLRVELAGELLFEDKVKRPEGQRIGLARDPGGVFYIDRLSPKP